MRMTMPFNLQICRNILTRRGRTDIVDDDDNDGDDEDESVREEPRLFCLYLSHTVSCPVPLSYTSERLTVDTKY